LYRKYQARGLVVLGFPMNDFGGQEPGSNKDISAFCVNQYAIDFPMFSKTTLKANPLYTDLAKATGQAPKWNFHKYLVDSSAKRAPPVRSRHSACTCGWARKASRRSAASYCGFGLPGISQMPAPPRGAPASSS